MLSIVIVILFLQFKNMEQIIQIDYSIFEWINHSWQNPVMDAIMPYWREKTTWVPAYLILAVYLFWKYKIKALYFLIALGITVGITDQISSELIKKTVKRDRPCREMALEQPARTLVHCGGGYSFPSSHAANHFAVAFFLILTWGRKWNNWKYLLLFWAASISIGQVYVGVHYPIDITFGSILGFTLGWLGSLAYKKFLKYRIDDFYSSKTPVV